MQAYKLKTQQVNASKAQRDEPSSPLASHTRKAGARPFNTNTLVDAIEEDEEDTSSSPHKINHKPATSSHNSVVAVSDNGAWVVPPTRTISKPSRPAEFNEISG
jgi:hypothetical protein